VTIRYEANPPKILPGADLQGSISGFVERIESISGSCDAVHLTENVLGFQRVSPIEIGKTVKSRIPDLPVTISLRVRDKTEGEIRKFVGQCADAGFAGILVLMGDPPRDGRPDSGQIPSTVVKKLRADGTGSRIDLYLSIPSRPDYGRARKKMEAGPRGFMTQVVQSVGQVRDLASNLAGFSVIPIVLFPSEKNRKAAEFLGLDMAPYADDFGGFVGQIHGITGDVLITSPGDFAGLRDFLQRDRRRIADHSAKYSASG